MCFIYIWLQLGPAAAPLIMCMRTQLGGVAIVCDYPHPAVSFKLQEIKIQDNQIDRRGSNMSFENAAYLKIELF